LQPSNNNSQPIILGIESSCDDTSAAVLKHGKIHSNIVATQEVHKAFGGVVPEMASRKHQQNIIPVVDAALKEAGVSIGEVDAIACTQGPGLMGSLLVGYTFTKGLALSLNKPILNVDHITAHIYAHFIEHSPSFPFLCLLVSGGHTQIVRVDEGYTIEILGATLDDAAGEAFDKAGKMLGLPYPAGPEIDKLAKSGNKNAFAFNTPKTKDLSFSFSGVKTSILYTLQKLSRKNKNFIDENITDLCASIQHTIVSYLISKLSIALQQTNCKSIGIAGGVAANSYLREQLAQLAEEKAVEAFIPKFEYCTDNAAMIAFAGGIAFNKNEFGTLTDKCFTRK
jgi:N6-L-threonylcarbamoyladenine synthase